MNDPIKKMSDSEYKEMLEKRQQEKDDMLHLIEGMSDAELEESEFDAEDWRNDLWDIPKW